MLLPAAASYPCPPTGAFPRYAYTYPPTPQLCSVRYRNTVHHSRLQFTPVLVLAFESSYNIPQSWYNNAPDVGHPWYCQDVVAQRVTENLVHLGRYGSYCDFGQISVVAVRMPIGEQFVEEQVWPYAIALRMLLRHARYRSFGYGAMSCAALSFRYVATRYEVLSSGTLLPGSGRRTASVGALLRYCAATPLRAC
eukprot:1283488-Rhodomonas_salina.4